MPSQQTPMNNVPAKITLPLRIPSTEVLHNRREVEIDHEGRIYRLRITQLNKLILTA
jgi:hemin uptake protein HemP